MLSAGIDAGSLIAKIAILKEGQVMHLGFKDGPGLSTAQIIERLWEEVFSQTGLRPEDISHQVSTGMYADQVSRTSKKAPEIQCLARGALQVFPSSRTVVDIGAMKTLAVRFDEKGQILRYSLSEKCASGVGILLERVARVLGIHPRDMSRISFDQLDERIVKPIRLPNTCGVFIESDIISILHREISPHQVLVALYDSLASRCEELLMEIGNKSDVTVSGNAARHLGLVDALRKRVRVPILVPSKPEFVGALGAGLIASERESIEGTT
jgi:predicted CoA-substrate-specific enzyme activase